MIVSKNNINYIKINIDSRQIERIKQYQDLKEKHDQSQEVNIKIKKARASFFKMQQLNNSILNLQLSLKGYAIPILLFKLESWTLTEETMKKFESIEIWIYRWMLKISTDYQRRSCAIHEQENQGN